MTQNVIGFPSGNRNDVSFDRVFGEPLQASGNLSYLEFIAVVKSLWENAYPDIKIKPTQSGSYADYPVIVYGLELRKAHTSEPKPRTRTTQTNKDVVVFGQRFQNIVSFTVITEANAGAKQGSAARYSGPEVADNIMEIFEDFMLEHTPVFKRLGASEFVYSRRLSDSEENRDSTDICKRTVTYMLTTEKLFAQNVDQIESIVLDVRRYMSYEQSIWDSAQEGATPDFAGTEVNIIDLYQSSTPNT
jgi:hypothetical protein